MKTVKVCELRGIALNWAVAKCEGYDCQFDDEVAGQWLVPQDGYLHDEKPLSRFNPSTEWSQGGPIIEREIFKLFRNVGGTFTAQVKKKVPYYSPTYDADIGRNEIISCSGPTMLIAAMRIYVASKLGDKVEIPEELSE